MGENLAGEETSKEQAKTTGSRSGSIKQRFFWFSVILFFGILAGGSVAFFFSIRQVVHDSKRNELVQIAEIERITLEASVNGEIAIALKMASSPLLRRHFIDPSDVELRRIAFDEIEGYRLAFRSKNVFWVSDTDKKFYFSEDNHYTIDAEDPANYWYKMTLYETQNFNFNINYNPEIQKTMLWINAPVFDSKRTPIGVVGTGIDLTEFVDSIYRSYSGKGNLYFFNPTGEITGARDAALIANKVTLDRELKGTGPEILDWVQRNPTLPMTFSGPEGVVAIDPIPSLGWYVAAIEALSLGDYLNTSMTVLFLAMMALIVLIFVIVNFIIRTFLQPLGGMVSVLNQIAKDWDLMKRLDIHRTDEIGVLADFFNRTFERIRELLYGIKAMVYSLLDTGEELSANMDRTGNVIETITKSMDGMRANVLTQADEVNKATGSIEIIISGLSKLGDHIVVQAESVEKSTAAIEQMLANIKAVTETLVRNAGNIASLAESSGTGKTDLMKVATDIQEIAKESEGLLEINSVMQTISSQTNLLAMNAAIEAAHAGESGRGFAVVADEIRKLAENSGQQSKTISAVLKRIKSSIDLISKSTSVVMKHFATIEEEVQIVSNQEAQIRNAMEEQGVGSRHILEAITQLTDITGLVKSSSSEMINESKEVFSQSGKLKEITSEVAGGMDDMSGNIDQIVTAITRAKEISVENKQSIGELGGEMNKFKVE